MNLQDEVKWENEMLALGVARFRGKENKDIERERYTQTSGGSKLLNGYLSQVSERIQHHTSSTNRGKYAKLLRTVDPDKLAMFALQHIISAVYKADPIARVAQRIGVMVEDELKFTKFYLEKPEFFEALQADLDRKNSNSYRHRHRVLTHTMNREGIQWMRWDVTTICGVGELVLRLTLDSTDLVQKNVTRVGRKTETVLEATPEVHAWLQKSADAVAVMLPDRMPCLIPPCDWTDTVNGGYHIPRLRMSTPLVKTRSELSGKIHRGLLKESEMPKVLSAINSMQRTAWCINKPVLHAMQEIWNSNLAVGMPNSEPYEVPPSPVERGKKDLSPEEKHSLDMWKKEAREVYALEQKRRGLILGISRTMRIAELMKNKEEFYYVYQCDFRGRVYAATTGVSPQGNDHAKAVLQFKKRSPLGSDGFFWLGVHGANKFGYDKVSYEERNQWALDNIENWRRVAEDPVRNRQYWQDADKPYQFLAWAIEYAAAHDSGDRQNFMSSLPIALDGSCNGLQHFSAMLRDPVGGAAVNLVKSDKPADIYQEVADVATDKLRALATVNDGKGRAARNWLDLFEKLGTNGMSRKLSKTPVMTLPYGSSQHSCTSSIFRWYTEQDIDFFPTNTNFVHCTMLSSILWASISEVVIAARAAMTWIQDSSAVLSRKQYPLKYTSELGFPVFQGSRKVHMKTIDSKVGGSRMQMRIRTDLEELDIRVQRQGSSPNLVHHVDATHMMMCVNAGAEAGIEQFAMIHDDFGVPACDVLRWHGIIREQFVLLHSTDLLDKFKKEQEEFSGMTLPDLPERGNLEILDVLDSPYFFG